MKSLPGKYLIILSIAFLFNFCKENDDITVDFTTGVNCKVHYGQGDCMPLIDYNKRKFSDYSGKVYIVSKRDYDNLIDINANCNCIITAKIDSLKRKSITMDLKDGQLTRELQSDSFIVMIDKKYTDYNDNIIYVKDNEIVIMDFYFFCCTSYK